MGVINSNNATNWSVTPSGITVVGAVKRYATYEAMLEDLNKNSCAYASVVDATGDPTVKEGGAFYRIDVVNNTRVATKIYETESMDIEGKITLETLGLESTAEEIDQAVDDTQGIKDKSLTVTENKLTFTGSSGTVTVDPNGINTSINNLSSQVTTHTENVDVHVTAEDKNNWNNKPDLESVETAIATAKSEAIADSNEYTDRQDYTAFEVYANDSEIPVGDSDVLGGHVYVAIPANMIESFKIRTSNIQYSDVDVVVDFGDGSVVVLKEMTGDAKTTISKNKDYGADFTLEHTYATAGKYTIKIFGKDYYGINAVNGKNLLCNCLTARLPLCSKVTNLSSFAYGATRLLTLAIPRYSLSLKNVINITNAFTQCVNLSSATGFETILSDVFTCCGIFRECTNLRSTDFVLPAMVTNANGISWAFGDCHRLAKNVDTLLPSNGFVSKNINVANVFYDCFDLTAGDVDSAKLWGNPDITWEGTETAFGIMATTGETYNLRAYVPTSWGGTNTEIQAQIDAGTWTKVMKATADTTYATITQLDSKVDKIDGKGLSTEDFTTALKTKLENLSGVLRWKGSCTWAELQSKTTGNEVGDVWQVTDEDPEGDTNAEYVWTESAGVGKWDKLGISIDVSGKMDKDTDAVAGNIPTLVSGGNVEDSGKVIGGSTLQPETTAIITSVSRYGKAIGELEYNDETYYPWSMIGRDPVYTKAESPSVGDTVYTNTGTAEAPVMVESVAITEVIGAYSADKVATEAAVAAADAILQTALDTKLNVVAPVSTGKASFGDGTSVLDAKGWYFQYIDATDKDNGNITLYLTNTQITYEQGLANQDQPASTFYDSTFDTNGLAVDDIVNIVNNNHIDHGAKVTAVDGNKITLTKVNKEDLITNCSAWIDCGTLGTVDYSVYCPNKPSIGNTVLNSNSFAFGDSNQSTGRNSFATGRQTLATADYSASFGRKTHAYGYTSVAEGNSTDAIGQAAHAEGQSTHAYGAASHTEGNNTITKGANAHAEGWVCGAYGIASHAHGYGAVAAGDYSTAMGKYNVEDKTNTYAVIVGNGTPEARSNMLTMDWSGNLNVAGSVSVNSKALITSEGVDTKISTAISTALTPYSTTEQMNTALATKISADGSIPMTDNLILRQTTVDDEKLSVQVGGILNTTIPASSTIKFATTYGMLEQASSVLTPDGSVVLTQNLGNAAYAVKSSEHTHSNKALLDTMSMTDDVFTVNGKEITGGLKVDESCVALSDLTTLLGRNNVAGGFPLEVVGYNVTSEHRYAWKNSGGTIIYTTKLDTKNYVQFYTATGTTSVAGKGNGVKNSTLIEPSLYAWTTTGNVTTGSIAYAYRNADSGVIYYCNTASASTSTPMYTSHVFSGNGVKPTAASGSPRVVTINSVQYTYTATYNKVTVYTETTEPSKAATGTALYYYTNTYNTSGSTLNATSVVIAEDFSQMTISNIVYTRDTTKDYSGSGTFNRYEDGDFAGSAIMRVAPVGGQLRKDDRFKSIYYKNAAGTMTDIDSNLVALLQKGVFAFVSNSGKTSNLSYAFRNATTGVVYYTGTTTPTDSTAMYLNRALTGTSVTPTAYTTTSPRTVTIGEVIYSYDANYNQFTTSGFINCTKDLITMIEKVLSIGSSAYLWLYQLNGPKQSGWNAGAQNWWVSGATGSSKTYTQFYNWCAANDGQPKDSTGKWKLYYKLGETETYVLISSAPSADNGNKSRPTEQEDWFDIYDVDGNILLTADTQKSSKLHFVTGDTVVYLTGIADAVIPVDGAYRDVVNSSSTVVLTAAQCAAGIYKFNEMNYVKVTKYDRKEILETALFDDEEIYVHPTMNSTFGLASMKFAFDKTTLVPEYDPNSYTATGDAPTMIGAVLTLDSDLIDPNNPDAVVTMEVGSMDDPGMAVLPSQKRGYTSFADGEYNAGIGYNCTVSGNSNEVYGDWSSAHGLHNLVAGMVSTATGTSNIVFADNSVAVGGSNKVYGDTNFVAGQGNMDHGSDSVILGSRNQDFGVSALTIGYMNEVVANRTVVLGMGNRNFDKADDSITVGARLKNYAPKSFVYGRFGEIPYVEGTRPEDTSVTVQMPIYGLPVQLTSSNISTYVGQTLYLTNSTLASGTYTQTTITSSHTGRWVIVPADADRSGDDNCEAAFLCMGDNNGQTVINNTKAFAYHKYRWSVNNSYFGASVGTSNRTGMEPYIREPFHHWDFTGVMSMNFTEAVANDEKYSSWTLTTRDGGRLKSFDPGKVQEDTTISNYYLDFEQATRWKIKAGTDLVLFPRHFVDGAEAYVVIYAGKTVSWSGFTNGEDTGAGANTFDSLVWVGGSAPATGTATTGFVLVKLMVVDNVCVAETIANTLA